MFVYSKFYSKIGSFGNELMPKTIAFAKITMIDVS